MGQIIHLSRERIQITVYVRYGGGRRPASAPDQDGELTLAVVQSVVKELGLWYFDVRTRSWPAHFFEAVLRGGWSAPIVIVGRTVVSQSHVPDRTWLRSYLKEQVHILRPRLAKSS
jgi:hypothetical protein